MPVIPTPVRKLLISNHYTENSEATSDESPRTRTKPWSCGSLITTQCGLGIGFIGLGLVNVIPK